MLSCVDWFTQPEMITQQDVMGVFLSNPIHPLWQHGLNGPLEVDFCAELKLARVRDNNDFNANQNYIAECHAL